MRGGRKMLVSVILVAIAMMAMVVVYFRAQLRLAEERFYAQKQLSENALSEQQKRFDETMEKVMAQMKIATDEMLKTKQSEFSKTNAECMGSIVNPLKETMEKMKQAMDASSMQQSNLSGALKTQIENAMKMSEAAKLSAEELSKVFKHQSKVQGDWGETILNELLQSQGLTEGVHYDVQATLRDANGNAVRTDGGSTLRPDVILHLDKQREVVIDSKVSLSAYMEYVNAENEVDRQRFLNAHIDSLLNHVKELSKKNYAEYIKPPRVKMDYVIMFVPHTAALWTAINVRPNLWREAMDRNVYIADEQTLYAALRIINLTWTQIVQKENHEKVYELANELMERVGIFMERYRRIGSELDSAQTAYEEGKKYLLPNGKSILQTCSKLQKLGARQNARHPIPELES